MARLLNAFEQFFDSAGKPLVSGLVDFFEAGSSSVRKDTFADSAEKIKNDNPVVINGDGRAPNVFGTGTYRAILRTSAGVQILQRDPVGGDQNLAFGADWNESQIYSITDVVRDGGDYWESLTNNNLDNKPSTDDGTNWQQAIVSVGDVTDNSGRELSTVAAMKADPTITSGQVITTAEHTSGKGSAGGNRYLSRAVTGATDDNGSVIKSTGNTAIEFEALFSGNGVDVKQFGAAGDGTTDDTTSFQAAIDYLDSLAAVTLAGGIIQVPQGTFSVSSTISVPLNISIIGDAGTGTVIRPTAGFSGTQDYVFLFNSTDGLTWAVAFPGYVLGSIKNFSIDATDAAATTRGMFIAGAYNIEDIKGTMLAKVIASVQLFVDGIKVSKLHSRLARGSLYQFTFDLLGDSLAIDQVKQGAPFDPGLGKFSIEVVASTGCSIRSCVGGNIKLDRCDATTVQDFHTENGQILIQDSSCVIKDSFISAAITVGVVMSNPAGSRNQVILDNLAFVYSLDETPVGFNENDVKTSADTSVVIRNCRKRTFQSGAVSVAEQTGIKIINSLDADLTDFNNYSYRLSQKGFIELGENVFMDTQHVDTGSGSINLFGGATGITSKVVWDEATDTYFYEAAYLYDPTRLIGRGSAGGEESFALTNGGNGVQLVIQKNTSRSRSCMVRLYRGTATGSYDKFVDIAAIAVTLAYDRGTNIAGLLWQSRTAGGIDSISDIENLEFNLNNLVGTRSTLPTTGTFVTGDFIRNTGSSSTVPDVNSMVLSGWRRITTGSAHVLNTDWLPIFDSAVTPAV